MWCEKESIANTSTGTLNLLGHMIYYPNRDHEDSNRYIELDHHMYFLCLWNMKELGICIVS